MESMTQAKATELIATGHIVCPYPRKGQVRVDGWKVYAASKELCAYIKQANADRLRR